MSLVADILATYRRPGRVVTRLLTAGLREDRALMILMTGCAVVFVAQWPRLARDSFLTGQDLNPLIGGALLGWLFIAPLFFYLLSIVLHLITRPFLSGMTPYGARLALFWGWLAASPILLFYGLVAGFIGPGSALGMIGVIWTSLLLWFWGAGFLAANRSGSLEGKE